MTLANELDAVKTRLALLRELRMELEAFDRKAGDYGQHLMPELPQNFVTFRVRTAEALFWLNSVILDTIREEQAMLAADKRAQE